MYVAVYYYAECPNFVTNGERLLNTVRTSINDDQLFNISHYWCTNATISQNISLYFTTLVHLSRLRVRGNSFSLRVLVNENETIYSDINGVNVSIISLYVYTCS